MADLTVSAPMVMAIMESGFTRHFYRGDVLPDDVSKESVEHLKRRGALSSGKDEFVAQPDGEPAPDAAAPKGKSRK